MTEEEDESFIPRPYQEELTNIALHQNTIIYLPTGSGKTFIAVMLLKQMSESLQRPYSNGGKLSFILVNTVALVPQHAKYINAHTVLKVGCYTGEMNLDNWRKDEWLVEFDKYQVMIMTCQILVNLINNNFIDLEKINLIIFDECHRGVEDQPMRQVMKSLQNFHPRILGLTATLLNGNCKLHKVMDQVKSLEVTYNSKVATVDGLQDVVGFSTNPEECFELCEQNIPSTVDELVINRLNIIIITLQNLIITNPSTHNNNTLPDNLKPLEPKDVLKKLRNLIADTIIHIEMLGTYGGYKTLIVHMIQVERLKKHCQESEIFIILNYVLTEFGLCKEFYKAEMKNYTPSERIRRFSSDKVLKLFHILEIYEKKSKEELCALIFVKRRLTARVIYHILESLKETDDAYRHLKSNFIIGNANNPYNDIRENLYITKKNKEVLDSFINKEINVLISSNVLEEGVDIPKCTLVVKFDKAEEYRSYIQSKGRARHRASIYYTIVERTDWTKFQAKYLEFQEVEQLLNDFLIGKNSLRSHPTPADLLDMYNEDEIAPYYVNGPNSAKVDMVSAIPLLSRYCNSLIRDPITVYAPDWYVEEVLRGGRNVRVVVILPTVCPILEPIMGPFMCSKKNAKRAAALKTCILLHKCGELDDNLLPRGMKVDEEDVSYLFKHWPVEKEGGAGHKNKKRLHTKEIARSIQGGIVAGNILYLHMIKLEPRYQRQENFVEATVYDLYTTPLCFGFLTSEQLPDICDFPIFDSNGTVNVHIKNNVKSVCLTQQQLFEIREFHFLIFNDLLEVLKEFLIFDNSGKNSENLLVVPVLDGGDVVIDFSTIQQHKSLKSKHLEMTASERMNIQVDEEGYLHKIVTPWYRAQSSIYVVTKVCWDKNPSSSFPNEDYKSFNHYYKDKHSLKILNQNQPLLLTKGVSQKLNYYKPRGRESKRKREKRYEEVEEYLVPEFVVKQEFPSCLWIQAYFLPTILSRVTYLLRLQQLQSRIVRDLRLDASCLSDCPSMELDIHLLDYSPVESQTPKEIINPLLSVTSSELLSLESPLRVFQQYNKDFVKKMLEAEYSWRNIDEPKDIERALNVTVMDIEYYEKFISQHDSKSNRLLKNESPLKTRNPAITYFKDFEEKPLDVLSIEFHNQGPNLCQFYNSLTTDEANDILNLERLEVLGDSFLKFLASMYLLLKFPHYSEGKLTTLKSRLISNRNLYYLGAAKKLGGILKNCQFSPKEEWVPPCFSIPQDVRGKIENKEMSINGLFNFNISAEEQISGVLSKRTINDINAEECPVGGDEENSYTSMCHFLKKQYVGDKTIADSVEALLGAFFLNGGITGGIRFIEWIGAIPASEDVKTLIESVELDPVLDKKATSKQIDFHIPLWQEFEKRLGYSFKNRAFLLQALTHPSYSKNRITYCYERLEFIGDAILDFLITCCIYRYCGYLDPGQVTDLRSALVNNNTFASLVVRNGFHKFLLMFNMQLQGQVDKFAEYLLMKNYVIDDEVLILLEENDLNIAEYVDVPKVLGDIFEALAGAVYLDSGKDLKTVWKVFYKIMWKEIELFSKDVPKNVVRRLYECHTAYPRFSKAVELENGKRMVCLDFMCEGRPKRVHGFGSNKIMAKRAAAKIALRSLKT